MPQPKQLEDIDQFRNGNGSREKTDYATWLDRALPGVK
jgi:hypothetical protein